MAFALQCFGEDFNPPDVPTRIYNSDVSLFTSHVYLSGEATTQSQNEQKTLLYKNQSATASGAFPVYGFLDRGSEIFQVFAYGKYSTFRPETDGYLSARNFYKPSLGLLALSFKPEGRFFILTGGTGFAEEANSSPSLMYYGIGLIGEPWTKDTSWLLGGGYLYLFGKPALFPVVGLMHKFNLHLTLFTILPVSMKLKYQFDRKTSLSGILKLQGSQYRFSNNGEFPGRQDKLFFRTSELRLSSELSYSLTKVLSTKVELGFTSKRNIKIADDNGDAFSETFSSATFALLTLSYAISESFIDFGI